MMSRFGTTCYLLVVLALSTLLASPGALADDATLNKHVVLYVEQPGKFEVLHSRAKSTATGAVFFGLIGAGIEESNRKSKDTEKEDQILVHIPDDACHSYMTDAFIARLNEKGIGAKVLYEKPAKKAGDEYVIRLKIDACGYRMVDSIDEEMAAYITAQYRIFGPGEKISGKLLELAMISKERRQWNDLLANVDNTVEEFRDAKRRLGTRLANKIIYMKPEK